MDTVQLSELLAEFAAAWHAETAPPTNVGLKRFFEQWRDINKSTTKEMVATLSEEEFIVFSREFSAEYSKRRQAGMMFNVWMASQLGLDERRNAKVLSAFLDKSGDHGQGSKILFRFLSSLGLEEIADNIATSDYLTRTEVWPLDDLGSRIDIEIENEFILIFVELKISANESGDQLQRYLELGRRKAAHRNWAVIYLTPNGRKAENKELLYIDRLKPASWLDVSNAVRSAAIDCKTELISNVMIQYAEFVASLSGAPSIGGFR
jgi:hypothetical protein